MNKKKKSIPKPTYFGANLKLLRRLSGLSQTELATVMHLTRNKIASYESGLVEPKANLFLEVSKFFKVEPKEILSTVFTNHLVESMRISTKDVDGPKNQAIYAIEGFIEKTNEMTKIMNAYKTMVELKAPTENKNSTKQLNRAFEELLELFQMLLEHNWVLINQMITYNQDASIKSREI